jgi:hypothetical protein
VEELDPASTLMTSYQYLTLMGLSIWGALSDERTGLSFVRVTVSSEKSTGAWGRTP